MKIQILLFFSIIFALNTKAYNQNFERFNGQSLYTDLKARTVGDVVTILIMESASGARQSKANSSDKASLNASGSITGNLTDFLPILGASSNFETNHEGSDATSQKDVLTAKVSAVVTKVLPNGNLVLSGRRYLEVNGETHILELRGIVRPKDITADNIVFSYNLANVKISYKKAGFMNKLGKPGWFARWARWMIAIGLGAAAYLGVSSATK